MFVPSTCPLCHDIGPAPCESCIAELTRAPGIEAPPDLCSLTALINYDCAGARLVASLKYRNARRTLPWLASGLANVARRDVDIVTWAPTHSRRRRHRGFDQAERLATHLARRLSVPRVASLKRIDAQTQTGRSRRERFSGIEFSAVAVDSQCILVIDDVVTTGATLRAAARALYSSGAAEVHGLAVAYTSPARRDRGASAQSSPAG